MAHAARLNLRMQKELKLLITDPPPGASFPLLSVDSDISSSLSTIHAQIEGPEGTVYARGIFDIKIQIPERYPFQPPSVTFATPIYHPNIDNGGRICLDILNLPPKGAWQPSLNISTVLTSIGLLLTEPNPDDGLMCEASREYKYNRQAFDQKARLMTEKHAKGGICRNGSSTQDIQTNLDPSMTECRGSEKSRLEVSEFISSQKKPCGISQKLSLGSSSSSQNRVGDGEVNDVYSDHLFFPDQMEVKGKRKGLNIIPDECNSNDDKPHGSRRKLSLESSREIQKRDGPDKENLVTNYSSVCDSQTASMAPSGSSMLQPNRSSEQKHLCPQAREPVIGSTNMRTKHLCQFGKKRSLESSDTFQLNDADSLTSSQVFLSKSNSSTSHGTSSMILSELQPHKDFIDTDKMVKCSTDAECKKISSVAKKLSLGSKGSVQIQRADNKENVAPVSPVDKLSISSHQSSSLKSGVGQKLSLGPLSLLQGNNDNNRQLFVHSENLSTASSRTLPMQQHYGYKEKQQSNPEQGATVGGKSEVQRIEDSPISEAVVVLDSEDSEDEKDGALRSKLLARKRMGKWRAKA